MSAQLQHSSASVVIRTFNESRYLPDVLRQLAAQEVRLSRPLEIIIVDSGSTDSTLEIAERTGAKIIRIGKHEFTFGRALNLGCEEAKGEFLVVLSGHCLPHGPDYLHNMLAAFSDPSVALAYGRQVGDPRGRFSETQVYAKYYPPGQASQGPHFCNNANAAVRRSIWRRFRYDEELTGLEDIDLGKKVVRAGFRVAYVPEAQVSHIHRETWPQVKRRYEREAIALRHIHPELHLNLFEAAAYFLGAVFGDLRHALRQGVWRTKAAEIVAYRFCQFHGSWAGNRPHRELSTQEKLRYFFPS